MPKTDKHASRAVFVAVDVCAHHQFPALILMEIQPSGVGTGTRLLGSKSCCSQRVERMRWRVDADDLRRVAASLIQQADSIPTYETREVLEGAYANSGPWRGTMRTHVVRVEAGRDIETLCRRVNVDNMADGGANPLALGDVATCRSCRARDPRKH